MNDTIISDWCEAAEFAIERADKRRRVPTPAEIRQACEAIQAAWSPRERHLRMLGLNKAGQPILPIAVRQVLRCRRPIPTITTKGGAT